MEESEKKIIKKNLSDLIEITNSGVLFTLELVKRGVLSKEEEQDLANTPNSFRRNKLLYDILETRADGFHHLKESLLKTNQSGVLKLLGDTTYLPLLVKEPVPLHEPIFFNVVGPCDSFIGRQKELKTLQQLMLQQAEPNSEHCTKYYITGLPGIGKTELARKLIETIIRSDSSPKYDYIIWINAENDDSVKQDFVTLAADKLEISVYSGHNRERSISAILEDVYKTISIHLSLLVFDNAENANEIYKYLPTTICSVSKLHILITSQDNEWDEKNQVILAGLGPEDATNFVKKGLGGMHFEGSSFDEDVLQLVKRLDCFPLAIAQAIDYIKDTKKCMQNYGPRDYLQELCSNTKVTLKKVGPILEAGYNKSTYDVFEPMLKKLEEHENIGEVAIKVAKLLSFLESSIIYDTIFENRFPKTLLKNALLLLRRFSVIRFSPEVDEMPLQINIHRLFQVVTRCVMESTSEGENLLAEADLLLLLYDSKAVLELDDKLSKLLKKKLANK